jgi:hypothetical protein
MRGRIALLTREIDGLVDTDSEQEHDPDSKVCH